MFRKSSKDLGKIHQSLPSSASAASASLFFCDRCELVEGVRHRMLEGPTDLHLMGTPWGWWESNWKWAYLDYDCSMGLYVYIYTL